MEGGRSAKEGREGNRKDIRVLYIAVCPYLMCSSYMASWFLITSPQTRKEGPLRTLGRSWGQGSGVKNAGSWDVRMVKIHKDVQVGGMQNLQNTQLSRH